MKRITSFSVDHDYIKKDIYISRIDGDITTYDLRTRVPNGDDYMDNLTMHSLEHMFATYIRNSEIGESVIYFGPMGCRTGFYLILAGDLNSKDIVELIREMIDFVIDFEGEIPGYSPRDCGNYLDNNLDMAKFYAAKYKKEVLDDLNETRLVYPE